MALKTKQRYSQDVRVAEFTFSFDDTMVATDGTTDDFKAVQANIFDVVDLPPNSVVVGGEFVTETAIGTSTAYNVKVGDSGSDVRYLGTTDRVTAGRTALVPTGYVNTGGLPVRLTVTPTVGAATAGKCSLRVQYVIRDRADEVA